MPELLQLEVILDPRRADALIVKRTRGGVAQEVVSSPAFAEGPCVSLWDLIRVELWGGFEECLPDRSRRRRGVDTKVDCEPITTMAFSGDVLSHGAVIAQAARYGSGDLEHDYRPMFAEDGAATMPPALRIARAAGKTASAKRGAV